MTLVLVVLVSVVVVNCSFMFFLISDVTDRSRQAVDEPGRNLWIGVIAFFQYLLSTFGISDFAVGAAVYSRLKWVSAKKMPGTLNTAAVIPLAFMALIYITSIEIDLLTLVIPIVAQAAGAYFAPRLAAKMRLRTIRVFLAVGMLVTMLHMVGKQVGVFPEGGTATALSPGGLALLGGLCLLYGVLNNFGLGSYAPTMATVYALGLNPIAAFPIMMGAGTFSVPTASIQFIRHNSYSRKVTILSAIFGTLGVLTAAFVIREMNVTAIRWLIAAMLLYSACSMLRLAVKNTEDVVAAPVRRKKKPRLSHVGQLTGLCVVLVLLCAVFLIALCVKNFQAISYDYTEICIDAHNAHLINSVQSYLSARESLLLSARVGVAHFMSGGPGNLDALRAYLESTSRVLADVSTLYCTTNTVWNAPGGYAVFSQPWDVPHDWDNTGRLWFFAAKNAGGGIAYSRPYIDALTGDVIMDMSCNVYDEHGADIGVISMAITVEALSKTLLLSADLVTGQQVYLIDSDGVFVVHPDKEMVAQADFISGAGLEQYRDSLLGSQHFNVVERDTMVLSSSIANTGWILVSMIPINELFIPINHNIISMFMMPLLIIFFMLLIVLISLAVIVRGESAAKLTAERITQEKNFFIARVSHEIRTPMNAVIGMSELAQRDYGTPKGLEYISGIKSAGAALLTIINDILDFSKIESGHLSLTRSPYETMAILNDVLTIIRVRMAEKNLDFILDIDPFIPKTLTGDAGRVKQILINLLSNAVKYTRAGHIRLSATYTPSSESEIRLTFTVEDTGIGIKPENMNLLFGVFSRVDDTRNCNVEGTGLGLSIARTLCQAMDGDITAMSEYGKGSVFTASLIQTVVNWACMGDISAVAPEYAGMHHVSFAAPGARILLVDDVPTNLLVAKGLLSPYEVTVDACENGPQAIELAAANRYDLVLMDHMMPDMDGIEATAYIRETLAGRAVPIIALTANAVVGMRETFLQSGMDDFLSKPINVVQLDEVLQRWIPEEKKEKRAATAPRPAPQIPVEYNLPRLTELLRVVAAACHDYDDAAAYSALDDLQRSGWTSETAAELEKIRDMLFLRSDFEGAAQRTEAMLAQLRDGV